MHNLLCVDRQAVPFNSRCDFAKLPVYAEVPLCYELFVLLMCVRWSIIIMETKLL